MSQSYVEFQVEINTVTAIVRTPLFNSTHVKSRGVNLNQFIRAILALYKDDYELHGITVNGRPLGTREGVKDVVECIVLDMIATGQIETHSVTLSEDDVDSLRDAAHQGYGGPLRDVAHNGYGDHPTIGRYKG